MKKNVKIIIIVVVSLLILAGAALSFIILKTDLLKSKDQMFSKDMETMLSDADSVIENKSVEKYFEKKMNLPYENNGKIDYAVKVETESSSDDIEYSGTLIDYTGKVDNKNNKFQEDFNLYYSKDVKFPFSIVRNDDKYGFIAKELLMKTYLVLENNNLKELAGKLGISDTSEIPDKISVETASEQLFTESEIKTLIEKYSELIKSKITTDDFSEDTSGQIKSYILTLKAEKIKSILTDILTEMKDDELIQNKYKEAGEKVGGYSDIDIIEGYKNSLDNLIDNISKIETNEEELKVIISEKTNGLTECVITFDTIKVEINIYINGAQDEIGINVYTVDKESDATQKIIGIKLEKKYSADDVEYNISAKNEEESIVGNLNYKLSGLSDLSKVSEAAELKLKYEEDNNKLNFEFKITEDTEFKESVDIEEFTETNSATLNELSKDRLQALLEKLVDRIENVNKKKIEQVGEDSIFYLVKNMISQDSIVDRARQASQAYEQDERTAEEQLKKAQETMNNTSDIHE